jgi:hypothetical protein
VSTRKIDRHVGALFSLHYSQRSTALALFADRKKEKQSNDGKNPAEIAVNR